jgi:hypothetical protein
VFFREPPKEPIAVLQQLTMYKSFIEMPPLSKNFSAAFDAALVTFRSGMRVFSTIDCHFFDNLFSHPLTA